MESKFSVYYDSNYLMIDSFEYEVLKNNLIHTKCIEKGNAPASSYHGVISWYNKFNVAGCNVTKVTIGFKVIDPEIDLSNITEILSCMRNKDGYDLTNRLSRNCNSSAHAIRKTALCAYRG